MNPILKITIFITNLIKAACLIFAFIYLIGSFLAFSNNHLFVSLNACVGFIPAFFSGNATEKMTEQFPTISYFFSVAFFIFLSILAIIVERNCKDTLRDIKISKIEAEMKKMTKKNFKSKIKELQMELDVFCGLFEFVFDGEKSQDTEDLKDKYTKILSGKLQYKYKDNLELAINKNGQLEIICRDFSKFDDVLKCYSALRSMNVTSQKLKILFSVYSKEHYKSTRDFFDVLQKINKLNYLNKVIVNDQVVLYANNSHFSRFNFASVGITKFTDGNKDRDVELFRLLNPSVSERYDK